MSKTTTQAHKWNTADTLSCVRMLSSLILLFLPLKTPVFYAAYTVAGLTDLFDGWIARKTGKESDFGAKLDSVADLLFYGIMIVRLLPLLLKTLPGNVWITAALVLAVRAASYITAAVKYRRFASLHTWLNKLTGAAAFLLPYILAFTKGVWYCRFICLLGFAASAEELIIHIRHNRYTPNTKSIFETEKGI